jgi:hypothetical protein
VHTSTVTTTRRRTRSASKVPEKSSITIKSIDQPKLIERTVTYQFLSPLVGEHRQQPRRWPRVGCLPDRLRHATLDLKRRREGRGSYGPHPGGPIGRHLAETKWPPPEQHNTSGMVLPDDGGQGDPSSSEMPQHRPVILEDLFLLYIRGAIGPVPPRLADGVPGERRQRELRIVLQVETPLVPAAV